MIAFVLGQHADAFPLLQNLIINKFESTHLTSSCQALTCVAGVTNDMLTVNTLNMVKLGQLYWDDIINQGLSVGHLISIFEVMWDTSHLTPM